ncbi:DUF885 family protein [Actinophytocola algeriensis]|nr:DUF885 family protein [Actinophytocola algeriensis]
MQTATAAVSEVVEHIFERYPHVARRAGRHDPGTRVPVVEPIPVADLDRMLARLRRELAELPATADPELCADLDAAAHVLAGERFPAAELDRPFRGPREWLAATDVTDYPRGTHAPLADRMTALRDHLTRLPDLLTAAGDAIGPRLPAGERLCAVEQARAQALQLADVERQVALDHPGYAADGISAAATAASAACRAFADRVAATAPATALHGPELLDEFLRATQGLDQPVADLLDATLSEVDRVLAALAAVAARLGVADRFAAFDLLGGAVSDQPVTTALTGIMARLRDFWAAEDLVSVDTVVPLEVRRAPRLSGGALVEFGISAPLAQERQPHILWVPEPEGAEGRGEHLNDPMLEVIAVHEAFAGHYVQIEAASMGPSVLRVCVPWFPGLTEGWAHYVEELALEHGLAEGRPLLEVAQLRFALEAATRLAVYLSVHMGRMTFADAVTRAITLCGWSPERAAREVLIVVSDPVGAMYTLGKLRIRQWRERVAAPELKRFHDRLVRCGSAPLSTASRYHLDGHAAAGARSTSESSGVRS